MAAHESRRELSGFDEPALWRANLGTAFSDLVPAPLDREVAPQGTLRGLELGGAAVFTVSGSPQAVRRTTTATRHSPADMLKVCVQLRGRCLPGRSPSCRPLQAAGVHLVLTADIANHACFIRSGQGRADMAGTITVPVVLPG